MRYLGFAAAIRSGCFIYLCMHTQMDSPHVLVVNCCMN